MKSEKCFSESETRMVKQENDLITRITNDKLQKFGLIVSR